MAARWIVADTSIWIDHINKGDAELAAQLKRRRIVLHPMIIGEVALGSLANRQLALEELGVLPSVKRASHGEFMEMIERLGLFNKGIGYVDAHLLASARLTPGTFLWTRDKRLRAIAERLEVSATFK
ncbi:MAG: type II toxin-antitoxin system VapC family toxin [Sphingomonadaceae bacterium]